MARPDEMLLSESYNGSYTYLFFNVYGSTRVACEWYIKLVLMFITILNSVVIV